MFKQLFPSKSLSIRRVLFKSISFGGYQPPNTRIPSSIIQPGASPRGAPLPNTSHPPLLHLPERSFIIYMMVFRDSESPSDPPSSRPCHIPSKTDFIPDAVAGEVRCRSKSCAKYFTKLHMMSFMLASREVGESTMELKAGQVQLGFVSRTDRTGSEVVISPDYQETCKSRQVCDGVQQNVRPLGQLLAVGRLK